MKVLLVSSDTARAMEATRLLAARLEVAGIPTHVQDSANSEQLSCNIEELALVVSVGGDGTFLHATHLIDFAPIPILGLNYGTLGFLSGTTDCDEVELIRDALAGDLHIEHRSTLDAHVVDEHGQEHNISALNDLVYSRSMSGRIVDFSYAVNGIMMSKLRADGIIISTSTGSTGYALSEGGPMVSPDYSGLMVVPIAPHTLKSRPLMLGASDVLELTTQDSSTSPGALFVDGKQLETSGSLAIKVIRGEKEVLIARGGSNFFENAARVFFQS